jgi:hypothetical protein
MVMVRRKIRWTSSMIIPIMSQRLWEEKDFSPKSGTGIWMKFSKGENVLIGNDIS